MVALRRLFVAVALTDEARHAIAARVGGITFPGRPTRPPNWHVTLRFIGETDEPTVDRVLQTLDESDLGHRFRIRWGKLGAFPRATKATVLWVGLAEGADELTALASRVESAITHAGLGEEDRPFRPHLTLSRIRPPQNVAELLDAASSVQVAMPVDRVVLMESHLDGGRARYETLESFELA